jgi:competence protein ComEC
LVLAPRLPYLLNSRRTGAGGITQLAIIGSGAASNRSRANGVLAAVSAMLDAERARWFNWVPVLFGLGIALYFWLPAEPSLMAALAPVPAAIVLKIAGRSKGTLIFALSSAMLCLAAGLAMAKLRTEWVRAPVLERQLSGVEVRGYVELVEPKPTKGQRITVRVVSLGKLTPDKLPRRVRIRTLVSTAGLKPGDGVLIRATLAAPAEPSEPGAFDFGRNAWYLGLGGIGYAMTAAERDPTLTDPPWQMWATAAIERVRLRIGRAVVAGLAGETGGIANALITGERGGISQATDTAYRDSGLYHILSISGLHMVVMAGAFFFTVRFVFAAIPSIALRYPIKKWAAIVAAVGALGYLLISGGSFATVRSYVMISIFFLAIVMERPALALRNVAICAMALLVVWPESLFDAGFQMSFAAVVALISVYEAIREREERLGRADIERGPVMKFLLFFGGILMSTMIATLAVAPFAAYQFHTSQQYGALANLVALPICDLIVMPAALATLLLMPLGLEKAPLWIAGLGIDLMTGIAYFVAKLPGAVIAVAAIPTSSFVCMVAGGLWFLLWHTRIRLWGVASIVLGLALAPTLVRPDILISRDGKLLAARIESKSLSALATSRGIFELSRWLEADGDQRPAKEVALGRAFRCDDGGCTATLKGQRLAIPQHASALADDCARASILLLDRKRPKACTKPSLVVDPGDIRRGGAHAIYLNGGAIRVETMAAVRGDRPWSRPGPPATDREMGRPVSEAVLRRLTQFAAPALFTSGRSFPRPEDEDDDFPADAERSRFNEAVVRPDEPEAELDY